MVGEVFLAMHKGSTSSPAHLPMRSIYIVLNQTSRISINGALCQPVEAADGGICYRFGHYLECFKVVSTIFPCQPFCSAPVAPDEIELAMKPRVKKNTVAQCFSLFLHAPFLILKVPLRPKNSASTAATLWGAIWPIVCGWTLQH